MRVIETYNETAKILPYWTHDYQENFDMKAELWTFSPDLESSGSKSPVTFKKLQQSLCPLTKMSLFKN